MSKLDSLRVLDEAGVATPPYRRLLRRLPVYASLTRQYRLAAGHNQVAVASAVGMTQQQLSQIEQGRRPVSLGQRWRFAEVLNIPLESLGLAGYRPPVAPGDADPAVAASRDWWRA